MGKTLAYYNDFRLLKAKVTEAGLFEYYPLNEMIRIFSLIILYLISLYIIVSFNNLLIQIFNAIFFALVYVQILFVIHDSGHQQIFPNKKTNNFVGMMFASLLTGNSYTWWVPKHNKHHISPNIEGEDPDINFDWIAFSEEQALRKKGFSRFITKYQAYLFFPLTMLESLNLRKSAVQYFIIDKKINSLEFLLFLLHFVIYFGMLFSYLDTKIAIIFIIIHQFLFGLLISSAFATNHKGMEIFDKENNLNYVKLQVITARNVRSNWFTDFWFGGLNFQIEHHLFPSIPRKNFRKVQKIVKKFCREKSISYEETGMVQSYRDLLLHFHEVGRVLRTS